MSMPPIQPNQPPPQYAEYPRERAESGSADKLEALAAGYFGFNMVFLANVLGVVIGYALIIIGGMNKSAPLSMMGLACIYGLVPLGVGFLSYPQAKRIAYGADWTMSPAFIAVLMGINTLICWLIGYIVLQSLAGTAIRKKFGIKGGFLGIRKKDVAARVAGLRAHEMP